MARAVTPALAVGVAVAMATGGALEVCRAWRAHRVRGRLVEPGRASVVSSPVVAVVHRRLAAAGLAVPPATVAHGVGMAVVLPAAAALWAGPVGLVLVLVLVAVAGAVGLRLLEQRARQVREVALADAVEVVASGLRTGLSLRQGLSAAAEGAPPALAADLRRVVSQVDAGVPMVQVLAGWGAGPSPIVRLAAAALAVGAHTGGAHARALSGVAQTIRDRVDLRAEVRAMAAQARLSALVITVAPLAFIVFTATTDHRVASFLLRTPAGWAVLAVGLALDAAAGAWMARLSRIEP